MVMPEEFVPPQWEGVRVAGAFMSIVLPIVFVSVGSVLILYRAPVAAWFTGRYEELHETSSSAPARAFKRSNIVAVGVFAIVVGATFLLVNIYRLAFGA